MSNATAIASHTDITAHTEYWDSRQHAWLLCGDHGNGVTIDLVPSTRDQARVEAADAWTTYIEDWVCEGDTHEFDAPAASYRLVWSDAGAEYDEEHLATVEIDVVRDDDTDEVVGYEVGAVELYAT